MNQTLPNPMALALHLAFQAGAWTSPNPMVGCVIAREAGGGQWEVLAHGFHERCGLAHAEVQALAQFRELPADRRDGAVLFVTLEPCAHTGRTGPCAEAIVQSGIRRVEIAAADPNPTAQGGAARLKAAGIEVIWGNLFQAAVELNAGFFLKHLERRPFVLAKWAMTADGKIATATGDSRWVSGRAARAGVMRMRASCDAVMVGLGTVRKDDPQLTARVEGAHQPLRVIVDTHLQIPPAANVLFGPGSRRMPDPLARLNAAAARIAAAGRPAGESAPSAAASGRAASLGTDLPSSAEAGAQSGGAGGSGQSGGGRAVAGIAGGCVVATGPGVDPARRDAVLETGAEIWELPLFEGRVDLARLLQELLARRQVASVLVEGGPTVLGSLFDRGLVDRVAAYLAPKVLGGAGPSAVGGGGRGTMGESVALTDSHFEQIGEDMLLIGKARDWNWLKNWEMETRRRAAETGRWIDRGA